ncbi:unnamed protein product [Acanthoscelides obtectus]|uniref:Uncharacterized protein n=1 Tax=Acanthoscelides obtectus TaxID=200917 RepID=A0A9P0LVN5_ACAOB|nr:unnamed protein product [Acanthoscelides obtectus]CAK1669472.1 hypothetical protein AOBTE_LOCUS27022 [Acanthoscelides obtectus]
MSTYQQQVLHHQTCGHDRNSGKFVSSIPSAGVGGLLKNVLRKAVREFLFEMRWSPIICGSSHNT